MRESSRAVRMTPGQVELARGCAVIYARRIARHPREAGNLHAAGRPDMAFPDSLGIEIKLAASSGTTIASSSIRGGFTPVPVSRGWARVILQPGDRPPNDGMRAVFAHP